ncbi:hypothetical protein I6N96_10910 [Enterococcus sp. BWM-S5]|uniref:Uncharacterized protein n=1 Tax=Enterococcus larvae TaxID=2794352 RepID=A0ABS4CJN3_9ENTE|nr:hypothetical protein [Enterococcus larvae]MBP1046776.1 hypothetical protein [Enterococcus larvae]
MNRKKVLIALENEEFDGISHVYEPYSGYNKHESYQLEMSVHGSTIEVVKVSRGKTFDGKENERYEERKTTIYTGDKAIDFIEKRPYYFSQIRPDLF